MNSQYGQIKMHNKQLLLISALARLRSRVGR
jgi:hypothetical protein